MQSVGSIMTDKVTGFKTHLQVSTSMFLWGNENSTETTSFVVCILHDDACIFATHPDLHNNTAESSDLNEDHSQPTTAY